MEEIEREVEKIVAIASRYSREQDEKFKIMEAKLRSFLANATPSKSSKRAKHLSVMEENDEEEEQQEEFQAPLRPVRTARLKATSSLKEPTLNSKLRQPSIKKERISVATEMKENRAPNVNKHDNGGEEEGAVGGADLDGTKRKSDKGSTDVAKKVKLSIEHIPIQEVKIEILSDDEATAKMMPPPAIPAKKIGRPKKVTKVKEERPSTVPEAKKSTRSTRTKSKKTEDDSDSNTSTKSAPVVVVKVEKLSMLQVHEATTSPTRRNTANSEASSVYEDAVTGPQKNSDATFVKNVAATATQGTSSKPNTPNSTFAVAPNSNATFQVQSPAEADGTYIVPPSSSNTPPTAAADVHDSIMTEDRSYEDEQPIAPAPLKHIVSEPIYKNGKPVIKTQELFNPLMQSPVKARVQAFEKMTTTPMFSPSHAKLRSKVPTKIGSATKGVLQAASSVPLLLSKATTPSSTSKLAHLQRKFGSEKKSTSRESSADRADNLKKSIAEDKKKKREERQRMVQQQREQMELEKRLKAEALMKEKEERAKKNKLLLEEQQRALRLQEQKREELVRLEQQRRLEQQQMEAIRSKQNESLQRKAIQKHLAQKLAKDHEFSILNTDDSTDDEGKMNKQRPVPPAWCKGHQKRYQIQVQAKGSLATIDAFFSVQPRTIDLKQIFPTIDVRRLKRNSSAVWRTPPRLSTLPK